MPVETTEVPIEAKSVTETTTTTDTLTANDRCDQCNAQAYTWILLEKGELLFCAHHWTEHKAKIEPKAIKIKDETHRLYKENRLKD